MPSHTTLDDNDNEVLREQRVNLDSNMVHLMCRCSSYAGYFAAGTVSGL